MHDYLIHDYLQLDGILLQLRRWKENVLILSAVDLFSCLICYIIYLPLGYEERFVTICEACLSYWKRNDQERT